MKGYVEKMITEYPDMIDRRKAVVCQLNSLKNTQVSVNDIIEALTFSHPDGERVQTSGTSDKVAKIALSYRDHQERMNAEMFDYWMGRYEYLNREITFLENSIGQLPDDMSEAMQALVIEGMTWEEAAATLCVSIMTLHRIRKQAIENLVRIYQKRESVEASFLLS